MQCSKALLLSLYWLSRACLNRSHLSPNVTGSCYVIACTDTWYWGGQQLSWPSCFPGSLEATAPWAAGCLACTVAPLRVPWFGVTVTHLLAEWKWPHATTISPPKAAMLAAVWMPLQFHDLRRRLCIHTARLRILGIEQKLLLCQGFGMAPYMMGNRRGAQSA